MTGMKKIFRNLGIWLLGGSLAMAGLSAVQAQTMLPDAAGEDALKCLQKERSAPRFPKRDAGLVESTLFMRVQLQFTAPDQPPQVTILSNTATEYMQDQVLHFVGGYRLPCLKAEQPAIKATQEFVFYPYAEPDGKPLRLLSGTEADEQFCIKTPRRRFDMRYSELDEGVMKVFLQADFKGDGEQAPEVTVRYSSGTARVTAELVEYMKQYRMPCRKAGDARNQVGQHFLVAMNDSKPAKFGAKEFPLQSFLSSMSGLDKAPVYFDFDSMACPFQVKWTSMRPVLANEARVIGKRDPRRAEFLAWLAGLELKLESKVLRELLGESLQVSIPCGKLELNTPPPVSPPNPT